jgi:TolB-like protein/Flp pilus assembly protein TadD/tRNA A-37 threonylcarbamoyl transferase component Bud32
MTEANDNNPESKLDATVLRFIEAQMRGEAPDIEGLVGQYPDLEQEIRQKIASLALVDSLFDSLRHVDASDFPTRDASRDLVGTQVDNFKVVEVIGRGGMGVVYKARDSRLDRLVAIKTMPVHLLKDPTAEARFRREAKLLASLSHPNVAVIYDIIEPDRGLAYLILEYVPGETLAECLMRGPLGLKETLALSQQIAEAVSAAHGKGVIHRDLKPSNVKITPEGGVKVLDFGLAKTISDEAANRDTTVTQAGRVIGTPAYMSPEQARGKQVDHRTDIWSFGCVMYEMLTGHLPFEGETSTDVIARILEREPNWQALPDGTPENMRALLRRCLEKDVCHRLQRIGDAALEISEALNSPASARPVLVPAKLRRLAMVIGASVILLLGGLVVRVALRTEVHPSPMEIRLAVLPFENLGSAEDEYFADGITDAITARLAGIQGLGVISRQSAMQYKGARESVRAIGEELGVEYVLEGTIQRERPGDPASKVRIIPQLVRVSDDVHVWAKPYDNDMSEVFQVQSDVAEQVAQALDITLLASARRPPQHKPTEDMEAYDYYLRGNEYIYRSIVENDLRIAIQMYERAIELDPMFALAYGELSRAHVRMYWHHHDHSEDRLTMAKQAIDNALQLDPDLPEVRLALGHYYYQGHMDYERALEQFNIARKSQPSNSELIYFIAAVQRRRGEFAQALGNFEKAAELDPRSGRLAEETGDTFTRARKYTEAERYLERAMWLAPDGPLPYQSKAMLHLLCEGSTDKARAVLRKALQNIGSAPPEFCDLLVQLEIFDRNYQEALEQLASIPEDIDIYSGFTPRNLRYAQIYGYLNKHEPEQSHYESARDILEAKVQEWPEDARFHSSLGLAYAGLGRKQEAIREGLLAVELLPTTKDALRGPFRVADLARIYTMVGDHDAAVERIAYLLSIPGEVSAPLLRLDPMWDPLRGHPRFKELIRAGERCRPPTAGPLRGRRVVAKCTQREDRDSASERCRDAD